VRKRLPPVNPVKLIVVKPSDKGQFLQGVASGLCLINAPLVRRSSESNGNPNMFRQQKQWVSSGSGNRPRL
jgi:hypothetical protein